MAEKWDPFREAEQRMDQYECFFLRDQLAENQHPQDTEDFLHEVCPENYCYGWIDIGGPMWSNKATVLGMCVGIPKNVALALRLITGCELLSSKEYKIKKRYWASGPAIFRMEKQCQD